MTNTTEWVNIQAAVDSVAREIHFAHGHRDGGSCPKCDKQAVIAVRAIVQTGFEIVDRDLLNTAASVVEHAGAGSVARLLRAACDHHNATNTAATS